MIKRFIVSILFFVSLFASAQEGHVSWSSKVDYQGDGNVVVRLIAALDSGWHISALNTPDGGLRPTEVLFDDSTKKYDLVSLMTEPQPTVVYDDIFEVDIKYHEGHTVEFTQEIKPKSKGDFFVNVKIVSQVCSDGGCVFSDETLSIPINSEEVQEEGIFWLFVAGLFAGFLALLTPCVFPMIPMTVTFFTKMAENRRKGLGNAFVYGISIIVIYVALGFGVSALVNEEAIYMMASSISFNIIFFIVFALFAVSFLGAFEITLPASLTNKMDAKADKGGLIGVFFMAFTLALVSFSCTGPVVGSLIIEAALEGGVKGPLMGMLGFGTALALPFTLFAIFPSGLDSLPKSGGWLNAVKVVLGLTELALAMKFLSNADIVVQAHFITREVFLAVWIVIFGIMGFYLLGKIRMPHDSKLDSLPVSRLILAIFTLSFVVYMIPGLFGAPLKMLSGILPPSFYTEGSWGNSAASSSSAAGTKKFHDCPNGLDCYHDYQEGLDAAKAAGKPLMIDFTGWTCTNCRKMEQNVWTDPAIDELIRGEFVLVSLYADDRTKLAKKDQYISKRTGELVETIGGKVRDFQINTFGTLAQPLYVIVDHKGDKLLPVQGFDLSRSNYQTFLETGLANFKKKSASKLNTSTNEKDSNITTP